MNRLQRVGLTVAAASLAAAAGCSSAPSPASSPGAAPASTTPAATTPSTTSAPSETGTTTAPTSGTDTTSGAPGSTMPAPTSTGPSGTATATSGAPEAWTVAANRLMAQDPTLAGATPVFGVTSGTGPDHATIDLPPGDLVAQLVCSGQGGVEARGAQGGREVFLVGTRACPGEAAHYAGRLSFPRGAKALVLSVTRSLDPSFTVVFFHAPTPTATPS